MIKYFGIDGSRGWAVQSAEAALGEWGPHSGPGVRRRAPSPGHGGERKAGLLLGADVKHRRGPAGKTVQMRTARVPGRRGGWKP